MRKIVTKDIFTMSRIISKAQLKDKLVAIVANKQSKDVNLENVGVETIFAIFECAGNHGVEQEVYKLLEDILEVKDIENMDIDKLFGLIKNLSEDNNLIDFFKKAGRLN